VNTAAPAKSKETRVVEATFVAGATREKDLPPPAIAEVAFAGRSNVGKSSLLNALVERKSLVRTSRTPGCTRQINVFYTKLKSGHALHLVDLPGYGYAKLSRSEKSSWKTMIETYLASRVTLRAVAVLVDIRRGIEPDDQQLLDFLALPREVESMPVTTIIVATKLDKLPQSKRLTALNALKKASGHRVIGFSSVSRVGREDLWKRILASLTNS
jgi:GTP-binding protein